MTAGQMADLDPNASSPARRIAAGLILLAGAAAIFVWIEWTGFGLLRVAHSRIANFRAVPATVQEVSIETRRTGRSGLAYAPVVRYAYSVAGTAYVSVRTTVLDEASTRRWAEGIAARFRPGQVVTAYYDPLQPDQAFLLPTTGGLAWWLIGLGAIAPAIAAGWAIRLRRGGSSSTDSI